MIAWMEYNTAIVLLGTMILGAAAGAIGSLALLRKRALLGDALSHATLPGVCLAFMLTGAKDYWVLLTGGFVTGIIGVCIVGLLSRYTRIKEDAAIGGVLSVFFGIGIVLIGILQKSLEDASQAGIEGFILGKTAGMLQSDLYFIAAIALLVLLSLLIFYKEFKLLCFDAHFAAVNGWPIQKLDYALMFLLTITTVIGLPAVGLALMVALLVIPAAAARFWSQNLSSMIMIGAAFGLCTGAIGTWISAEQANLPTGPVIVLVGTVIFALSALFAPHRGLLARKIVGRKIRHKRIKQIFLLQLLQQSKNGKQAWRAQENPSWSAAKSRSLTKDLLYKAWIQEMSKGEFKFTQIGLAHALRVAHTKELWKLYLLSEADIDRDLIDPDSELIERILPPEVVASLEAKLAQNRHPPAPEGASA